MKPSHPRHFVAALLLAAATATASLMPASAAQYHQGLQGGWAIDDSGQVDFLHSVKSELPYMQQAGAGVLRLNFRLGACFTNWTSSGCSTTRYKSAMAAYDEVVNNAISDNLQVVGLLSNEAWPGSQRDWIARNAENTSGAGDNTYIQQFAQNAAGVLAQHFAGRITTWEVWNEPNAWTSNPRRGVYTGSSFIYPSNFAWLLKRSYAAIKTYEPGSGSVVVSGGLFGHDLAGAAMVVVEPNGSRTSITKHGTFQRWPEAGAPGASKSPVSCSSTVPSGADYLCNTYVMGQQKAGWVAGAYPLDGVGQHLYIDQGGLTSPAKLTSYLSDVRNAYVAFEGAATPKRTEITEFGWSADPSSADYTTEAGYQAQNVQIAYTTFQKIGYLTRADYFVAQDVPEGSVFYGLVEGDGVTYKPGFTAYQRYADY